MLNYNNIATEKRNAATSHIDEMSSLAIATAMNNEDKKVPEAIQAVLPDIARAIDIIADRLAHGGHLFFIGAGTSGRLGVLDAAECPPTFGTAPEMVQGIIAGGKEAMFVAQEGAEDREMTSPAELTSLGFTEKDVLVGLAASGRTPYTVSALNMARKLGAPAIAITCSPNSPLKKAADIAIVPVTGPEVISGSTRLKAGTAQKLVLNMLSTGSMIRLGKVYGNLMVDVKVTNIKLKERAIRIIIETTGCSREAAESALIACGNSAKLAILYIIADGKMTVDEARKCLREVHGYLGRAIAALNK